ncbi:MAG TPA: prolyl oligopeptidase family serine peptidase [Elusimicrobiales bacterium]|nr:prolyl oligopeptidase family serine peptidase [Elusimicrobiales bacterium]
MRTILIASLALLLPHCPAAAQEDLVFQKPPAEILALADYERSPSVQMDSKKEYLLLSYRNTYKSLAELSQEEMRLGGLRINPVTNISSEITYVNNLKLRKVTDSAETQVSGLPPDPQIANISWSRDEKKIAFTHTAATGVELWVIDVASARAERLTGPALNANLGRPYAWLGDNETLLARLLPAARPALIDTKKELPKGPAVSVGEGAKSQNRTYADLLKNPADEANFETLAASELHKVTLAGKTELFKPAALYAETSVSPDGAHLLVTTVQKPFSYIVPYSRFPLKSVVYGLDGTEIKVVNEVPLSEIMPQGFSSVRKGKRSMDWCGDKPAELYYVEALDDGDQAVKAEFRDELFLWDAPFTAAPVPLLKLRQRFYGLIWGDDSHAVAYDFWYDTRNLKTYLFAPSKPGETPKLIGDRNYQDIYSDPGHFETRRNQNGQWVLLTENDRAYLLGDGYTKDGQFPFIDELDLGSLKTTRLYRSAFTDKKEELFSLVDASQGKVLARLQSPSEYPNYYFRDLKSGALEQLTHFPNPFESIRDIHKEVIKYERKDGVKLSGTLYLPAGYDAAKKEKLPLLIWAYPQEFKDKNSAGQNTKNSSEFTYPHYGSFVYWVTRGYAVLDNASFPIVGAGKKEPNDTFIKQLVLNAEAAIGAVDKLGFIDRSRVGVGGHSYGAFMVANLLTHSKLFACGVARSGSYNRTLTPFGFQGEQRNYWDAPDTYNAMSPFATADKMKTPLLLVHGDADNNPGTFTLQTERYFQALKGLGAPVRMVLLPKESHGYASKENILHLLWEQDRFFEKYLKTPGPATAALPSAGRP